MQKTALTGVVIEQTPSMIVMKEGETIARYSKDYYRLPNDQDKVSEPIAVVWTDALPVAIDFSGLHGILAPVYS